MDGERKGDDGKYRVPIYRCFMKVPNNVTFHTSTLESPDLTHIDIGDFYIADHFEIL